MGCVSIKCEHVMSALQIVVTSGGADCTGGRNLVCLEEYQYVITFGLYLTKQEYLVHSTIIECEVSSGIFLC